MTAVLLDWHRTFARRPDFTVVAVSRRRVTPTNRPTRSRWYTVIAVVHRDTLCGIEIDDHTWIFVGAAPNEPGLPLRRAGFSGKPPSGTIKALRRLVREYLAGTPRRRSNAEIMLDELGG